MIAYLVSRGSSLETVKSFGAGPNGGSPFLQTIRLLKKNDLVQQARTRSFDLDGPDQSKHQKLASWFQNDFTYYMIIAMQEIRQESQQETEGSKPDKRPVWRRIIAAIIGIPLALIALVTAAALIAAKPEVDVMVRVVLLLFLAALPFSAGILLTVKSYRRWKKRGTAERVLGVTVGLVALASGLSLIGLIIVGITQQRTMAPFLPAIGAVSCLAGFVLIRKNLAGDPKKIKLLLNKITPASAAVVATIILTVAVVRTGDNEIVFPKASGGGATNSSTVDAGQAPTDSNGPLVSPDGTVHIPNAKITYFDVTATTLADLQIQFKNMVTAAETHWYLSWNVGTQKDWRGHCSIKSVSINKDLEVSMPRWKPPADASPESITAWNNFLLHLAEHEQGHVDIIMANLDSVKDALINSSCEDVNQNGEKAFKRIEQLNEDYDTKTNHGVTQGVAL